MSVVPSQILYIEHNSSRLYAEAIQIVNTRQICWARPTLLIQGLPEGKGQPLRQEMIATAVTAPESSTLQLYDLEGCPDLIWPTQLFQIACDIDFFSLLIRVKMSPDDSPDRNGNSQFTTFIRSFWNTHPDIFHPSALTTSDASSSSQ